MLLVLHGAVLAVLPSLALPLWVKAALAILLLCSLPYYLLRHARLSFPESCTGLSLEGDVALLHMRNDTSLPCAILRDSLVTPYLTVLNLLPQGARFARTVIILPDSLDAESFRQLRVRLKWSDQIAL